MLNTRAGVLALLLWISTPVLSAAASEIASPPPPIHDLLIDLQQPDRGMLMESTVQLPASIKARASIEMSLRSDLGRPEVVITKPVASAGPVRVESVSTKDNSSLVTTWKLIPLQPVAAGQGIELTVRARGGTVTSLNFHVGKDVVFAGGGSTPWYPKFGQDRIRGRARFKLPPQWKVQATGTLSTPPSDDPDVAYDIDEPTTFGFVAGPFKEFRQKVDDINVRVLLTEDHSFAADLTRVAAATIRTLETEFGPYPYTDFAIIEVPTKAASESGFIGAAYAGFMLVRSDFLAITKADPGHFGHEIGHQWWGVSVQRKDEPDTPGDYMLDEALAQYGALRAVEAISGAEAAAKFRGGQEGLGGEEGGLNLVAAGFKYRLGNMPHEPAAYMLSDTKGYLVYDMLSRTMGAENFRKVLRSVTHDFRGADITWQQFVGRLTREKPDLQWFFDQWFNRDDVPIIDMDWNQDDALHITLTQQGNPYRLTLPIVVAYSDGSSDVHWIETSVARITSDFALNKPVARVLLDPKHLVFHATQEEWKQAKALSPFTRGHLLWDNGDSEGGRVIFRQALENVQTPDVAGLEFLLRVHLGWIAGEAKEYDASAAEYAKALELAVRSPKYVPRLYWNISRLERTRGNLDRARWAANQVIAATASAQEDSSLADRARALLEEIKMQKAIQTPL